LTSLINQRINPSQNPSYKTPFRREETGMGKLMVAAERFLPLCAVLLLVLPALAVSQPTSLPPGWYRNSGPSIIFEDSRVRITWENSYIYPYPGQSPLYWYAEVIYLNTSSQTWQLTCSGQADPSLIREHITRGTTYLGYVAAEETFCSRNPNFNVPVGPGAAHHNWAIFHNVPWPGDKVSLEWAWAGFSAWVNPWHAPFGEPPPAECPPELVTLGTCQHDACIFRHDNVVPELVNTEVGHVAWGWKIPGSNPERWVFGSTDSVNRSCCILPGQPNGFWTLEGSFGYMRDTFRARGYRELKCRATEAHAQQAARQEMERVRNAGYWVAGGNNCMNHTVSILNAYGANDMDMPNPHITWLPDDFFNQMEDPWQHGNLSP
jgi:hypothetical protein